MKELGLLLWAVCSLYVGTAGWARAELEEEISLGAMEHGESKPVSCGGITFSRLSDCLAYQRDKQTNRLFPWVFSIPAFFGLLLQSFGFGSLGAFVRLLRMATRRDAITGTVAMTAPLFGGLVGIAVLGVAYVLPEALVANDAVLRPTSLLFFTLFGGMFADHVYSWLERTMNRLFPLERGSH